MSAAVHRPAVRALAPESYRRGRRLPPFTGSADFRMCSGLLSHTAAVDWDGPVLPGAGTSMEDVAWSAPRPGAPAVNGPGRWRGSPPRGDRTGS
jgi:hypothetical protein